MAAKGIRLLGTGRALPKTKITNEELSAGLETDNEWIVSRTGIHSRYRCKEESCTELAVLAAERALASAGVDPAEIGVVVGCTSSGDDQLPSVASHIQKELGLPEALMAFDISSACCGFLDGLTAAAGLLQTLDRPYALVVGCEKLSRIVDYTDRSTCILFGDGAGAVLIGLSDALFCYKRFTRGDREMLYCPGAGAEKQFVQMKGQEVFKFAVTALKQAIDEVFKETGLTMSDIHRVICHQANERIIRHVQRQFPEDRDKFYLNIQEYGNTSAASIPIALDELREKEGFQPGEKLLLSAFGAGLCWGGMVVEL